MRQVLVIVALGVGAGCSFMTVTPPRSPSSPPPLVPQARICTESTVAPVVDSVLGTGAVLAGFAYGAIAMTLTSGCWGSESQCQGWSPGLVALVFLVPAAVGALFYGSAYYGFTRVAACRNSRGP